MRHFYAPNPPQPKPRYMIFSPKDDITTAELAGAVRFLTCPLTDKSPGGIMFRTPSDWDAIPEAHKRHWAEVGA